MRREPDRGRDDAEHEEERGSLCHQSVPTLGPARMVPCGVWISPGSRRGGATGRRSGPAHRAGGGRELEREPAVAADVLGRLAGEAAFGAGDEEVLAGL